MNYDNQNIIAEYDENNKLIASYVHGPNIDEPLSAEIRKDWIYKEKRGEKGTDLFMIASYVHCPNIDEPLSAEIRRDWIYYHADGLGSITTLTSHMGNVVQKYEYDAFGNMSLKPYFINQPFTYTAREFDPETGLYYYRARYYDAKAGRFITRDPIGFDGGDVNLYAYVGNNPVNFVDPEGLFAIWPVIKAAAWIGATAYAAYSAKKVVDSYQRNDNRNVILTNLIKEHNDLLKKYLNGKLCDDEWKRMAELEIEIARLRREGVVEAGIGGENVSNIANYTRGQIFKGAK